MDVTITNHLLIRVKVGTKYWIGVMHRITGNLINQIPSACDHVAHVNKHPRHPDYILESCSTCEEIRGYGMNTKETFIAHKGSKIRRMFDGPAGSLLTVDPYCQLSKLTWNDDPLAEAEVTCKRDVSLRMLKKQYLRFCCVESHGILLYTAKDRESDKNYEIIAVNLENHSIVWRLFGPVEGHVLKPESMTCDNEGNVFVTDLSCNRILKINCLTREIMSILLVDEEDGNEKILSIRWCSMEPNLTIRTAKGIRSYFVPK